MNMRELADSRGLGARHGDDDHEAFKGEAGKVELLTGIQGAVGFNGLNVGV